MTVTGFPKRIELGSETVFRDSSQYVERPYQGDGELSDAACHWTSQRLHGLNKYRHHNGMGRPFVLSGADWGSELSSACIIAGLLR